MTRFDSKSSAKSAWPCCELLEGRTMFSTQPLGTWDVSDYTLAADPTSPSTDAASTIMKTKHDTVKNSISNVR